MGIRLQGPAPISRRRFLKTGSLAAGAFAGRLSGRNAWGAETTIAPLAEFSYGDVLISSDLPESQLMNTHAVLMELSEDSLLKPFRQMSGMPAPGEDLGGWYQYNPDYDYRTGFDTGFAPACTFGQWVSALARVFAITGDQATRDKVLRLNQLYAQTITDDFYTKNRFPAYTYDKLLLGLLDSHTYVKDPAALSILEQTTNTALPHLPGHAVEHDVPWRTDKPKDDASWTWDESYTMPENLFLAYQRGAGRRYYDLGLQYLDDETWFDPLSRNENVLKGRHAYSYVNSLSSAMMAYLVAGSEKHLHAAKNAFAMLQEQSYATGGWGPDEALRAPDSNDVFDSLTNTHHSFETPCGSYAHFKLTRYLLRVTRDSRYGDSMERVMYNTVLGAKPLQSDGENFYYADYNFDGKRVYKQARWACCSGTLPQVAADYQINAYFRGPQAVYVNLYVPSTLRWAENGASLSITQESNYPYEDHVTFTVTSSMPTELTLHFRIPAWAEGSSISVNGFRKTGISVPGKFAAIRREWKTGDRIELELPLKMRLEMIDARHAETVALLQGPLVLMAVKQDQDGPLPKVTRAELLAAKRMSQREWRVDSASGPMTMLSFTSLGERPYTTYLKVS
ncbi:glycoside hydrolase family 127 protein [Alloacidobacterium dinghuense]|uniref:Glycoside hydrolase family 127 protein n=1 Tax=Alloacidobacterium dinghuense TaxID=2763107 RepID=A0A7G8BJJ5_9BACT|nr:beta-L-arabinofuranosidase domain-containing protein [Alloacidobacterium dinghuense]QNI32715.1 glycoside hydrolase family 127 protein [Alloacidobacterium dinghuense]